MKIDLKPGSEIAVYYFLGLLVEAFAAGEAAAESTNHFLRVYAGLGTKDQGFSNGSEIDGDDDLICQLCKAACSERPHVRDCFSQCVEDRKRTFEVFRFPSGHYRQR